MGLGLGRAFGGRLDFSTSEVGPWRRGCLVTGLGLGRAFWSKFDSTPGSNVARSFDCWRPWEVTWFLGMILAVAPSEFQSMASSNAIFLVVFLGLRLLPV